MVDLLNNFLFHSVLHNWFNNGRGMYYHVLMMMHIKELTNMNVFMDTPKKYLLHF